MWRGDLAKRIMWHMAAWGFGGGAVGGLIYGVLLFAFAGNMILTPIGGIMGFLVGGLVGGPLGLLNSLMLIVITHQARRREMTTDQYRLLVCSMSALLTGVGALFGLARFFSAQWDLTPAWWFYVGVPAFIAAIVAIVATARVVGWVENGAGSLLRVE